MGVFSQEVSPELTENRDPCPANYQEIPAKLLQGVYKN